MTLAVGGAASLVTCQRTAGWQRRAGSTGSAVERRGPSIRHAWSHLARVARRRLGPLGRAADPEPEPVPPPPPEAVLDLLRHLGVSLTRAGDATERVTHILEQVAGVYAATGVTFFVVPTGVFVRITTGDSSRMDFEAGTSEPLRLDQIDALYRLIDDIRHGLVDAEPARARLDDLLGVARHGSEVSSPSSPVASSRSASASCSTPPPTPSRRSCRSASSSAPCVGGPTANGCSRSCSPSSRLLWSPQSSSSGWHPRSHTPPLEIVIPTLVTFLPGAALTMATVELSTGDILAGSARLVYGLERLLVLAFGIAMGAEIAGFPTPSGGTTSALGAWAPWVGVLVFGVGQFIASSAPRRTLGWLLLVLYVGYGVQAFSGRVLGTLGACFLAAATVLPSATRSRAAVADHRCQSPSFPPSGCLVPGALGLRGCGADRGSGPGRRTRRLPRRAAVHRRHRRRGGRRIRALGADRPCHVDVARALARLPLGRDHRRGGAAP